jgi:hypothetical protein
MAADRLTPEQRALISRYREKWQHIGLSTERINQQLATDAVRVIYTALELSEPKIIDNHLHAEDAAAIAFTDGYSLYAHHGKIKLERTRKPINDIDWAPLLEKINPVEIDSWEEYKLLRVVKRINVQPMQFLKTTNPSTGEVRFSKVPLRITSAIEAVHWVNRCTNPK